MTIVAISSPRLPKVSRSSASLGRALERWLFELDQPPAIELGGVGAVRVRFDGVDSAVLVPAREELALIGRDGRRGRIAIDLRLALALVSGALGSKQPLVVRGLGVAERGVLAGQVASVLSSLLSSPSGRFGGAVAVDVTAGAAAVAEPFASVGFSVEACGISGRVRLDLPGAWLASAPVGDGRLYAELGACAAWLRTVGGVELALTRLPPPEWASARPGDVVVFDGVASLRADGDWPIELRIGARAAAARLDAHGALSLLEPFRPAAPRAVKPPPRALSSQEPPPMSPRSDEHEHPDDTIHTLAGAPIEVVAEVGRLSLRGDELLRLQPGSVLPLGARGQEVQLLAGGEPWARGELVDVDGELGVRISALSRRAPTG